MNIGSEDLRQALRYRNRPERADVMSRIGLDDWDSSDHVTMYRIFRAIGDVVRKRRRCVFPGLGTFEWKPRKGTLPDGRTYRSKTLKFALTRADRRK